MPHIDDFPDRPNQYGEWCTTPANAFLTGSRKYGLPALDADYDMVIFTDKDPSNFYDDATGPRMYNQVRFCARSAVYSDAPNELVEFRGSDSSVELVCDMPLCDILRADFASGIVNNVNFIPVVDPNLWRIWVRGTMALSAMAHAGMIISRSYAIELFTELGLPRRAGGSG